MGNLLDRCSSREVISQLLLKDLLEYCGYGSIGMMNHVVDCIQAIRARLLSGQKVFFEESYGNVIELDMCTFKKVIEDKFPAYVVREAFNDKMSKHDIYFSLKNTEQGFDLVYTCERENKMFKWIANISDIYALVYLRVNNVVYILNRKTKDVTPMVSEHNNHYVYDTKDGKIKEVM